MIPAASLLMDTTLRDGEQAPGVALSAREKETYVKIAEEAGISYIEVGFPQNPLDLQACKAAARAARRARIVAMALTTRESVSRVSDVGAHEVLFVVPSSSEHLAQVVGQPYEILRDHMLDSIQFAASEGLAINIGLEDASQGDLPLIRRIMGDLQVIGDQIDCVTVPDTRGRLLPHETATLLAKVRSQLPTPGCRLAFHAHNDLGLATANSISALSMDPPVDCVHVTACGYGERAGNASLEQVATILELKLQRHTGIQFEYIQRLCDLTQEIFLTPIGAHQPIVGAKIFQHESGLHQKALLQDERSYQFVAPQFLGRTLELLLGKHSGHHLRQVIARNAGVSEAIVTELQSEVITRAAPLNKAAIKARWESLIAAARIGLTMDEASARLRESASDRH